MFQPVCVFVSRHCVVGRQGAHIVLRVPRGVIVRDALGDIIGNSFSYFLLFGS